MEKNLTSITYKQKRTSHFFSESTQQIYQSHAAD